MPQTTGDTENTNSSLTLVDVSGDKFVQLPEIQVSKAVSIFGTTKKSQVQKDKDVVSLLSPPISIKKSGWGRSKSTIVKPERRFKTLEELQRDIFVEISPLSYEISPPKALGLENSQ